MEDKLVVKSPLEGFTMTIGPTNHFRWLVPPGGHNQSPMLKILQQAWKGSDGSVIWRNVPMVYEEAS